MSRISVRIAVVAFSTKRERPVANKKFDDERRAAAYLLEILLRDRVDFVSVRKIKQEHRQTGTSPNGDFWTCACGFKSKNLNEVAEHYVAMGLPDPRKAMENK